MSSHEALGAKDTKRTASTKGIFTSEAHLNVSDAQGEEDGHGVVQNSAIPTIKLGDGRQDKGVRDGLKELHVAATLEEEGIRVLMVAGIVLLTSELVTDPLLVLDALVDNAITQ
ncbi:MAG: hypothetical protein L6R39_001932 [Caloplaca ligustica]|nr:MAG: hypothetical protein L6R39_001932 [Caloplaca ligustica]